MTDIMMHGISTVMAIVYIAVGTALVLSAFIVRLSRILRETEGGPFE